MIGYETPGEIVEVARKAVAQKVGEEAVKAMHAVVTLEIREIRPLSGVGQGWENSI